MSAPAARGTGAEGRASRLPASRDLRLLPVAIATWAGALASILWPDTAFALAGVAWASAVGLLVLAGWRRGHLRPRTRGRSAGLLCVRAPRVDPNRGESPQPRIRSPDSFRRPGTSPRHGVASRAALVAVACAAVGTVAGHVAAAQPEREAARHALDTAAVEVVVEVTTKVEQTPWGTRFAGTARTSAGEAPVTVQWRGDDPPAGLDLGARVVIRGEAEASDPGEAAVVTVFADEVSVADPPAHVFAVASSLRRGFVADVSTSLPGPGGDLLPGLSVGETSAVTPELDAAMKASSLSHLTAVSGSNCALVVGLAFGASAACGAGRRTRVVIALAVLGMFVLLVTPEASVIRAATMSAIAMLALLLGRRGSGVAVLSLAVVVLLATDPWLAASYGFLLSASATGALLLLAPPLARGLERWMPRVVALAIAVPLAAQLVCGPIIVLFASEVALYGVVANIVAGPAAPPATVLGLIACLAQPLPLVASGTAALAWLPSAWVARTAETFAALPAARLGWWEGALGGVTLALVGALVTVAITGIPVARPGSRSRPRVRRLIIAVQRLSAAAVALLVGVGAGAAALGGIAAPLTTPREWSVALCDVGQGDAIVIRSEGRVVLVDTGPDAAALEQCLTRLGVDSIDVAFVTHFDADHASGIPALDGRVGTIVHGPAEQTAQLDPAFAAADHVREGYAGMHGQLGDAMWRILWPARETRAFSPGNDTSLVLEVGGGAVPRTLLLGDLGADAQRLLMNGGAVTGEFDVVKVSHHGSRDQFPGLYAQIRARVGLIGVGENDYGHPHPDALAALARPGSVVARSDTDGLVLVGDAERLAVWREHPPP